MQNLRDIRRISHQIEQRFAAIEADAAGGEVSTSVAQILSLLAGAPMRAQALGMALGLEKSTVSRLVGGMTGADLLVHAPDPSDRRAKLLKLSGKGRALSAAITKGLNDELVDFPVNSVASGMMQAARALGATVPVTARIETGYRLGVIGRMIELHGTVYEFDQAFEAFVARDLAELTPKLGNGKSQIWTAVVDEKMVGGICLDGDSLRLNRAEIRFFVLDEAAQGLGLGQKLLKRAIGFAQNKGFEEISLRTFEGLDSARALYERAGFTLVEEKSGDTYGRRLTEQKFALRF